MPNRRLATVTLAAVVAAGTGAPAVARSRSTTADSTASVPLEHTFEPLDVHLIDHVGIATGIVDAIAAGCGGARRTAFTDVFAYRNGRWRAVNAQETPVSPR